MSTTYALLNNYNQIIGWVDTETHLPFKHSPYRNKLSGTIIEAIAIPPGHIRKVTRAAAGSRKRILKISEIRKMRPEYLPIDSDPSSATPS